MFLKVENLNRSFGGLRAVNNVSFSVPEGVIKAIIGPNGAGKTTIFNLIAGSLIPSSGTAYFQNRKITGLKPFEIAQRGILRTFQNIKLCPHLTVLENVMLGRHTRSRARFVAAMLNLPWTWKEERAIRVKAQEMLEMLDITDLAHTEAGELPFGKQRSVELARALAAEPRLLLLDEPAAGLNIYETQILASTICTIKQRGITILLVEHDMSLVMDISDEITVLNFGQKIAEGTPEQVQSNPEVVKVYLGDEAAHA